MAFYSLDEILKHIIQWEKDLDSFYEMMEEYLKNEKSRKVAKALQRRQKKTLFVLENLKPERYRGIEFVKYVPGSIQEDKFEILANASIDDIFKMILEKEEQRLDYYTHLKNIVVYQKSRDLFEMLIQLKLGQIKEIKGLMDSYQLAL